MRSGMPLKRCLQQLLTAGQEATLLVAHNLSYDIGILKEEFHRAALPNAFASVSGICTMRAATNYCRLPKTSNRGGYKYPKLDELHRHLFGYDFINAHNAEADTEACMRCFFELCKLGIIDLSKLAPSVACPPQSKACVPSNAPRNSMNSGNIDSPPQDDYLRSHETAIDRKSNHHARGNRDKNIVGGSDLRNPYQRAVLRFGGQSEQGLRLGSGFSYPTQFEFPVASTSGRGNDQATILPTTDKALSPPAKQMDAVSSWQSDRRRRQDAYSRANWTVIPRQTGH